MKPRIRIWRERPRSWAWRCTDTNETPHIVGVAGHQTWVRACDSAGRHWITQHAWRWAR